MSKPLDVHHAPQTDRSALTATLVPWCVKIAAGIARKLRLDPEAADEAQSIALMELTRTVTEADAGLVVDVDGIRALAFCRAEGAIRNMGRPRRREQSLGESATTRPDPRSGDQVERVDTDDSIETLLPQPEREAVRLAQDGHTHEDAAERAGVERRTFTARLQRARAKLAEDMDVAIDGRARTYRRSGRSGS